MLNIAKTRFPLLMSHLINQTPRSLRITCSSNREQFRMTGRSGPSWDAPASCSEVARAWADVHLQHVEDKIVFIVAA